MTIKVDRMIMPLIIPLRRVARFSGAAVVVIENKKNRDHIIMSQNKLKILLGKRTRNQRRHTIMRTINSILKMHHLVRTMPIEWTTKGSRTDMTTQQTWDKINIKMRHNIQDPKQDQAPSPL